MIADDNIIKSRLIAKICKSCTRRYPFHRKPVLKILLTYEVKGATCHNLE